jgi:M6 family metalloprotease-like protein
VLADGDLVPSKYVVGKSNPRLAGLVPDIKPSPETIRNRVQALSPTAPTLTGEMPLAPTTGLVNNIVIFIRFSDETEFGQNVSNYEVIFNSTEAPSNCMSDYFAEVSYGKLNINSTFYPPSTNAQVLSYQDPYPRAYYSPYDAIDNPEGYQPSQKRAREQAMLINAIRSISSQVPPDLDLDANYDGYVDHICFIVRGSVDPIWASLLWPHMDDLPDGAVTLNSKQVRTYNLQLQYRMSVGALCHEMFHSLGAPDLYRYYDTTIDPVGPWDLMNMDANPPQHMGAYMKYRYGHWIDDIPEITASGIYTLNPLQSSSNNCYRIASPYSTTECFLVEYRQRDGVFEPSLPGSGLVVYRIDTRYAGNAFGPPDGVYVYRPNGTLTSNGYIRSANFCADRGRTSINDSTNPSCFLSDNRPGGLNISQVGYLGDTIQFRVDLPTDSNAPTNVSLSPTAGNLSTGQRTTFTTEYIDTDGWDDLTYSYFLITVGQRCYVGLMYDLVNKKLYLRDDQDRTWLGGYSQGEDKVIENSYCRIYCKDTNAVGSENTLTISWVIELKASMSGKICSSWMNASDKTGLNAGWDQMGTYAPINAPFNQSLLPASGDIPANTKLTFDSTHSDPNGWSDLKYCYFVIATGETTPEFILARYDIATAAIYLRDENDRVWLGGFKAGEDKIIENSYGKIYCKDTQAAGSGNTLTVSWAIELKSPMSGRTCSAWMYVSDKSGLIAGWDKMHDYYVR